MRVWRGLGLVLPVLWASVSFAEIYRWTDAEGRIYYTQSLDKVPPAHREAARRAAARGSSAEVQRYQVPASRTATPRRIPRIGEEIRIPFRRDGSLMLVDVRLNDVVTAPFLIDTGASGISLPAEVAERLGIRVRPEMPTIEVQTANGVVTRAVVGLQSVQLGPARVENLRATVNPAMQIGLLGGEFFNNFIYRVNAAEGVIHLLPNEGIRGGMAADQWRNRFRRLRDPLARLERYLEQEEGLRQAERARLERRREELRSYLSQLDLKANRMDVPQRWRY